MKRVGVREFREDLSEYLQSPEPVAVTRHGQTIGFYLPARTDNRKEEIAKLHEAVEELQVWLAKHGITEDDIVDEFDRVRHAAR
jgi:hypothetical protein